MKVQELAKLLNLTGKEMQALLRENNVYTKSQSSKLDPQRVTLLKQAHQRKQYRQTSSEFPNVGKTITFEQSIIKVPELAQKFEVGMPVLMKIFLKIGKLFNINSELDQDIIKQVAPFLNIKVVFNLEDPSKNQDIKESLLKIEEAELDKNIESLKARPPVVSIMGHVDHGKTALLDVIRQSNLVSGEAGGITQHIGAYQVEVNDQKITFLDTPGHEAFTALRARGAQITDIAILVVSADEGIKPQTKEAVDHANAAGIPILVAINKIDLPNSNVEGVKTALTEIGLTPEDWGGKTIMVPVSAKTKEGLTDLIDMLLLLAETLELQSVFEGPAKGIVIESRLSSNKGPLATLLIKTGCLKVGDSFAAGAVTGKVRALFNEHGKKLKQVFPGDPVEILGFSAVPEPGQVVEVFPSDKIALKQAEAYKEKEAKQPAKQKLSLEALSHKIEEGQSSLPIILKADVHGSLDALKASIDTLSSGQVSIQLIHEGTGAVSANDITLAKASQALIFAFNVPMNTDAQKMAVLHDVDVKLYKIIYEIIDDLTRVTQGMYKSVFIDVEIGRAEVRELFSFSKVGTIAGCMVVSGHISRKGTITVLRNNKEIHVGAIDALKRFKEDVKQVKQNFECGITLDKYDDIKQGDILVCKVKEEQKP